MADRVWVILMMATMALGERYPPMTPSELIDRLRLEPEAREEARECGLFCLAFLAQIQGVNGKIEELRGIVPIEEKGTSLTQLATAARKIGLPVEPVRCAPEGLERLPLPAVAHLEPSDLSPAAHWVVVLQIGRESVVLFDWRTRAVQTWPREDFVMAASGYYLAGPERWNNWPEILMSGLTALAGIAVLFTRAGKISAPEAPSSSQVHEGRTHVRGESGGSRQPV